MAVKTFGSEILTSGDVNTYLANSGLVYVTSQAVGTGVSSVTVTGCFSSTYDNYKVIYTDGVLSSNTSISVQFGSAASNYYGTLVYANWSGTTTPQSAVTNNGASAQYCGGGDTGFSEVNADVLNPFRPKLSIIMGNMMNGSTHGTFSYRLNDSNSYSSITLFPTAGTMTGGIITVYGYRKG